MVSKYGQEEGRSDNINTAMQLMDKIDDSLKPIPSDETAQQNESGSSKYDESWSSTLPSFQETPVKSSDEVSMISSAKEHSIEDFIEQQGTLSK